MTVHRLTPRRPELPGKLQGVALWKFVSASFGHEWRYRHNIVAKLHELVQAGKVELIEAADHMAEPLFFPTHRYPEIPFVVRLHTPLAVSERVAPNLPEPARRLVKRAERRFLLSASHLTAPGHAAADAFRHEMALDNKPITVFPNPPTYPLEHALMTTAEDPNLVLFVGRLAKWKGVHLLVQAIPKVVRQHPEARFTFVGADHVAVAGFPSAEAGLRSLLPLAYHHRLTFTGHVPHEQLSCYYRQAAVCVFPSLFEAFGYTCLEAMSYGKAVVGSRNGGMAELLEEGRSGCLFTPPDVEELAGHITRLLGNDDLRRCLGVRARRRAFSHYNSRMVLDQVETFYRRALEEVRRGA